MTLFEKIKNEIIGTVNDEPEYCLTFPEEEELKALIKLEYEKLMHPGNIQIDSRYMIKMVKLLNLKDKYLGK